MIDSRQFELCFELSYGRMTSQINADRQRGADDGVGFEKNVTNTDGNANASTPGTPEERSGLSDCRGVYQTDWSYTSMMCVCSGSFLAAASLQSKLDAVGKRD